MPVPWKFMLILVVGLVLLTYACSTAQSVAPFTPTAIAAAPANVPAPNPSADAHENPASPTPTNEPTPTPAEEPTATPTSTITPTPTMTPTPVPPVMLRSCAEIWQPGYYKLASNIKTPNYNCFLIQTNDVVFDCDNHSIQGTNYSGYAFWVKKFGFPLLKTPTNIEIKNCRVSNHRIALLVEAGNNLYIHHNDFSNNRDDTDPRRFGIFLGMTEGGGIRLNNVQGARVENNIANNQAIGIDVRDSERIVIRQNLTERNSAWGISLVNTSYSEVSSNTTRDNVRYCAWGNGIVGPGCDAGGIFLQDGSSHNVIKDNLVSGQNGNGIFIKAHGLRCGDDNLIQNNKIIDALYNAIEFSFCKDNKVIGNEITGSYDAIFFGFSVNTVIRNNVIRNMRNHGIISYNSRDSVVADNRIFDSREGIYFYWDIWDQKQFYFLPPSPDNYASRGNWIINNVLHNNSVAGIHLSNSIQNRVENNSFSNNGKNIWVQGRTDGNIINP